MNLICQAGVSEAGAKSRARIDMRQSLGLPHRAGAVSSTGFRRPYPLIFSTRALIETATGIVGPAPLSPGF